VLHPSGTWTLYGSPSWEQLTYIDFENTSGSDNTASMDIDGLCFNFGRWRYVPASDSTSISDFAEHDLVITDENLRSDAMCESRAKTLLYQHKDPVTRLDFTVLGNTNIILGDRLEITLGLEGLSSTYFYVTTVEHIFSVDEGWKTTATALDTVSSRNIPTIRESETLANSIKRLQQISRNQKRVN
jgi:hypothetical protein